MGTMERIEGPQTPFEVYCHHCQASFAVGTKRCLHCGRRLGARGGASPEGVMVEPQDLVEGAEPALGRRLGGMSLWVLLAIGAAPRRRPQCTQRFVPTAKLAWQWWQ